MIVTQFFQRQPLGRELVDVGACRDEMAENVREDVSRTRGDRELRGREIREGAPGRKSGCARAPRR
jgi:hypothetical protein